MGSATELHRKLALLKKKKEVMGLVFSRERGRGDDSRESPKGTWKGTLGGCEKGGNKYPRPQKGSLQRHAILYLHGGWFDHPRKERKKLRC